MTTVWPVIVSVRHIVTTMSAQSSLSAGFFSSDVVAERSINSGRRLAGAPVPPPKPRAAPVDKGSRPQAHPPPRARPLGNAAADRGGGALLSGCPPAGDPPGRAAPRGIHARDMHPLLRRRVTDALPDPAVAAGHQCDRAPQVHQLSPYAND